MLAMKLLKFSYVLTVYITSASCCFAQELSETTAYAAEAVHIFAESHPDSAAGEGIGRVGSVVSIGVDGAKDIGRVLNGEDPRKAYAGFVGHLGAAATVGGAAAAVAQLGCGAMTACRLTAAAAGALYAGGAAEVIGEKSEEVYSNLIESNKQGEVENFATTNSKYRSKTKNITGVEGGIEQYNFMPEEGEISLDQPDKRRTIDKPPTPRQEPRQASARDYTPSASAAYEPVDRPAARSQGNDFMNQLLGAALVGAMNGLVNGSANYNGSRSRGHSPCYGGPPTRACWNWIDKTARSMPNVGPTLGRITRSK